MLLQAQRVRLLGMSLCDALVFQASVCPAFSLSLMRSQQNECASISRTSFSPQAEASDNWIVAKALL